MVLFALGNLLGSIFNQPSSFCNLHIPTTLPRSSQTYVRTVTLAWLNLMVGPMTTRNLPRDIFLFLENRCNGSGTRHPACRRVEY